MTATRWASRWRGEQAIALLAVHAAEWAPSDVVTPFSLQVRASTG